MTARPLTPPHPQLAEVWAMLAELGVTPADPLRQPLAEARAHAKLYQAVWNRDLPPVRLVVDSFAPTTAGSVPLRLFLPDTAPGERLPVLIYFHGGGFVLNGLDTHERLMRLLAIRAGVAVVGVGYSLAPEHRFPRQLDEALAAVAWVRGPAGAAMRLDGSRLVLGGDSAGANLALATTLALRDRGLPAPRLGLLLYGMFSADLDTPSHRRFGGGGYGLTTERVDWFWKQYLADYAQRDNPYAAPLRAELEDLPPQHLIAAGHDCLLDDSRMLARELAAAGVEATLSVYEGVPHSFMLMSEVLEPADHAVSEAAAAVRAAVAEAEGVRRCA